MAENVPTVKPQELVKMGLLKTISLHDFSPSQDAIDAALGVNKPQQGNARDAIPGMPTTQPKF